MFNLPEGEMISPDDIKGGYEKEEEECEYIEKVYNEVTELIESLDNSINNMFLKMTLGGHLKCIESRDDWTMCQKTARRKRIIAAWHNNKVINSQPKDKEE